MYYWGGNGPELFDCSGLIVWAYQSIISEDYIFTDGSTLVNDVTMDTLYKYNTEHIKKYEAKPGDIIFISNTESYISHGGLIVEVKEHNIIFINASSYYGKIVIDDWEYDEIVRGQWIVSFGHWILPPC
ncbi:hypothetical protein MASR2M78_05050 [Treponema sp.]